MLRAINKHTAISTTLLTNSDGITNADQGRIQDLEKEGAQGVWRLAPMILLAHFGDFLKNLAQKRVGVRLPAPPLDQPLLTQCWVNIRDHESA